MTQLTGGQVNHDEGQTASDSAGEERRPVLLTVAGILLLAWMLFLGYLAF